MLFNSYVFIFCFLPVTWFIYFALTKFRQFTPAKIWLLAASLFFYSFYMPENLLVLGTSILFNYSLTAKMATMPPEKRKSLFRLGLVFNIGSLAFFKYTHFMFPLGISFFTIQQIAFLVDSFQEEEVSKKSFIDYALFVSFFPQIISGPIARYEEVIPQHESTENKFLNIENVSLGFYIFVIGLFKKVIIADTLSVWVKDGYTSAEPIHLFLAWGTSLAYTFQLYFDFSGYTDMAIGLALLFNIKLPQNFNSPFIAKNINDFWSRWHMSLSKFIRTYIFTPLQQMMPEPTFCYSMLAMFIAMVIAGAWHGAAWTFVIYGAVHGIAIITHYTFKRQKRKMPGWLAWLITFNFVNLSFVLFRAPDLKTAIKMYAGMLGLSGIQVPKLGAIQSLPLDKWGISLAPHMTNDENLQLAYLVICFYAIFKIKNSLQHEQDYEPQTTRSFIMAGMFVLSLFGMNRVSDFIYFNF